MNNRLPRDQALHMALMATTSRRSVLALAAAGLFSVPAGAAWAGVIQVGAGGCSLVDAITAANADVATGSCPAGSGADTLHLPAGSTQLLTSVNNSPAFDADHPAVWGPTGLPIVTSEILIKGHGSSIRRAPEAEPFRILGVNPGGKLTLQRTTLSGGASPGDETTTEDRVPYGGGLMIVGGTATLQNSSVSGNTGTGIFSEGGTLSLQSSTVSENSEDGIKIAYGSASISNSTIADNLYSGITASDGVVSASDSDFTANGWNGLSLSRSTVVVKGSRIENNAGPYSTGGVFLRSGTLRLIDCTVSGNASSGEGGGIFSLGDLRLVNSSVSGNNAYAGGGGIFHGAGTLSLNNSTVSGNASYSAGGGIWIINARTPNRVVNSTISGNIAQVRGGGIELSSSSLTLSNSTVSGNSAGAYGGGLRTVYSDLRVLHSTVTQNAAPEAQGAGLAAHGVFLGGYGNRRTRSEIFASIIAGNLGTDVDLISGDRNAFFSLGDNLIGDGNAIGAFKGQGDRTRFESPGLGPLSDNGGPTLTHALLEGSPAIDALTDRCPPPAADQRGIERPQGSACDIGAFELEGGGTADDTRPDRFDFKDESDVAPGSVQTSNAVVVSGIGAATTISVSDGRYSINGGEFRFTPSTVNLGDRIRLRQRAPEQAGATISVRVSIGGVRDVWKLRTSE